MKRSTDRMLTTHVGSIARSKEMLRLSLAKERGEDYDREAFERLAREGVEAAVKRQSDIGIDIVTDCDQGRSGFASYVAERLGGFERRPIEPEHHGPWAGTRDEFAFPEFYDYLRRTIDVYRTEDIVCVEPITYTGQASLEHDLDNLRAALKDVQVEEAFMTALGPSQIEALRVNEYYPTHDEFLEAIADAMNVEYRAIVDAGFVLQVDDPRVSTYYITQPDQSLADIRTWMARRIEVLNDALRGIPRDKVRLHCCYSIDIGPRVHDMDLEDMVDILLQARAGALSFEASNPRHEHEYHVWEDVKLPDDMVLLPGVVSHTTPVVEHPALVAERISRFAGIVGRENVIASADCGFAATTRDEPDIHPSIAWAKLQSLARGAELATKQLWDG